MAVFQMLLEAVSKSSVRWFEPSLAGFKMDSPGSFEMASAK